MRVCVVCKIERREKREKREERRERERETKRREERQRQRQQEGEWERRHGKRQSLVLALQIADVCSIRRGWMVYQEVCSACHSLDLIAWRNLVGVVGTEAEVKEWAADHDYEDGPNDEGDMYDRPGALTDHIPRPYRNDNEARAGNNGALPPDLSLIKKARVGGEDYLFSLLTGYREAPHGVVLREGMHYNPYFAGGAIGMEQALHDEMIDYEDGTPSSISQMAKDVSVFLTWAAEPEHDERKRMGLKAFFVIALMCIPTLYFKRLKWSVVKTRQLRFTKL